MERRTPLWAAALAHGLVDYGCFVLLWGQGQAGLWLYGLLAYDIVAFGLQPLLGAWLDERPWWPLAPAGCLLVGVGLALAALWPGLWWAGLLVAGVGNAAFHVGAGAGVLRAAGGKLAPLGLFVATGALGVAFGKLLFAWPLITALALLLCATVLVRVERGAKLLPAEFSMAASGPLPWVLAAALLGVALRAAGGWGLPQTGFSGPAALLLPAVAAALGKALGGVLGDRLGALRIGLGALLLAVALLAVQPLLGGAAVLGAVFCLNITMPLALGVVASLLPGAPGLAFGLTTLALLLGTLPGFFWRPSGIWFGILLAGASALCLGASTRKNKKEETL